MADTKIVLPDSEIPRSWYNILADAPHPPQPPLHPGTGQPIGPDDLAPLFPMELILQEVSTDREIPIPDEVLDVLSAVAADAAASRHAAGAGARHRVAHLLQVRGRVAGRVAQAQHRRRAGLLQRPAPAARASPPRPAPASGAARWPSPARPSASSARSTWCNISYQQKPYRRVMMETWGAQVVASPSPDTNAGRSIRERDPESLGSLGIAISEAVEDAATREDTSYSLGSVLNHVLLHQTVIGQEAQRQLALAGETGIDVVVGCVGGGSNFGGLALPFVGDKIAGAEIEIIAAEPAACPTLTRGPFAYDFGDTAQLTPLVPMHTLGHDFVPPGIHAGGLRYHGVAPIVSQLLLDDLIRAEAYTQNDCFAAALRFARSEGIIPAPESSHAIKGAIDAAKRADESGKSQAILFNLSGHGHFDMAAYESYLHGSLEDFELPEEEIQRALRAIEPLPKPAGASA